MQRATSASPRSRSPASPTRSSRPPARPGSGHSRPNWCCSCRRDARYFSVAGLPDARDGTSSDFLAVAYAFPTDTRVEWSYDEAASKVRSVFKVQTVAKEGQNLTTFMGLYPHHWSSVVSDHPSQHGYDTVRGRIRLVPGNSFTLERTYNGFVPMWAGLEDAASKESVGSLLVGDLAKSSQLFGKMGRGTYWVGKASARQRS